MALFPFKPNVTKRAPQGRPESRLCLWSRRSEIELERELDFPLIVLQVASRGYLSKSTRRSVIQRAGRRNHPVATITRRREVGMVADIKDFRPELQTRPFRSRKLLKERGVHAVEARPQEIRGSAAQRRVITLAHRSG